MNSRNGLSIIRSALAIGLIMLVIILPATSQAQENSNPPTLQVLTKQIEPFVSHQNGTFSGFSIELWQLIAEQLNWKYELILEPSLADLLLHIQKGQADVAIAAVTITAEREKVIDFSHPFFRSGLAILTRNESTSLPDQVITILQGMVFSKTFVWAGIFLLASLLFVSHVIWLLERRRNSHFHQSYLLGIWDSFWWALVTLATVGYGDKAPLTVLGRLFAMFWMVVGYFMFAIFTASVVSSVTIRELHSSINGPDDLPNHKVAVIAKSTSASYLKRYANTAILIPVNTIETAYDMLASKKVDAIVHDAPVLLYYTNNEQAGKTKVVGPVFHPEEYGVVLPQGSKLREPINSAILKLVESGEYKVLHTKWFGQE